MIFTQPEFKKQYYLIKTQDRLEYDIHDIYINNIKKLADNKGYILTIHNKNLEFFNGFDKEALNILSENSNTWFNKDLNEDDLRKLYQSTVCQQQKTMQVILTDNTMIYVNNKAVLLSDVMYQFQDMSWVRKCVINMTLQHNGLYIYSRVTCNKWIIKNMNIYHENDNEIDMDNRGEIEESWYSLVNDCNNVLDSKIRSIENNKNKINTMYKNILQEKNHKLWESKIDELKKIIQNIIF